VVVAKGGKGGSGNGTFHWKASGFDVSYSPLSFTKQFNVAEFKY
jgi:hypothetical protein